MAIVITAFALLIVISLALVWIATVRAPEGYEDESGFHYTAETIIAEEKPMGKPRPLTAVKAHDDHEPIAA